jgi:hypothetical protein
MFAVRSKGNRQEIPDQSHGDHENQQATTVPTPSRVDHPKVVLHHQIVEHDYTDTQGQYLAFIYYYTKLHGVPPAEADMQRYFKVTGASIHNMVVTL